MSAPLARVRVIRDDQEWLEWPYEEGMRLPIPVSWAGHSITFQYIQEEATNNPFDAATTTLTNE